MNELAEIKAINRNDLHHFLQEDHTNFSVLSVSAKHIQSTNRLTITLSKNSAQSFYVSQSHPTQKKYCQCLSSQIKLNSDDTYAFCSPACSLKTWLFPEDSCLTDAQNCLYFNLFNSKEKKLYTRFIDKVEANFEGQQFLSEPSETGYNPPTPEISDQPENPENPEQPPKSPPTEPNSEKPNLRLLDTRPFLFLTLTFNTTDQDYYTWTTNWDPADPCWDKVDRKKPWYKKWALKFDPLAEPMKIHIPPVEADVSQADPANSFFTKFLKAVRRLWKPQNWKWVVVRELQKNGNWHFHLLSTPIVPYSHICTLDKNFTACANCRVYISELWPYGRVESRSPGEKTISKYLAKYLSKSFHLRKLYQDHGLNEYSKTYSFFKNLYSYEEREAFLVNNSKIDAKTGQFLAKNQKIFRSYNYTTEKTSYFYRTNEQLVGKAQKPHLIHKNYRLATRCLKPLNLLKLASKSTQKEAFSLKKPKIQPEITTDVYSDFQEFLITRLLVFCKSAEFINLPLEQDQVLKLKGKCDKTIYHHFKPKPILHFKFAPEAVPLVLSFLNNLDFYAEEHDIQESKEFYDSRFSDLAESRNAYLNQWQINTTHYRKENALYTQGRAPG